jgi:hypothetical protein
MGGMGRGNGDDAGKAKATKAKLDAILRKARIREAKDANAEVQKRSKAIERARQARVRARRRRS